MGQEELFEGLPEQCSPAGGGALGAARLREPARDQIELRAMDLDSLIGADDPVRVIWGYASRLDLSALENAIKSREGVAGHPAIAPRLLLALWLYATIRGVGSARALAKLCERDDGFRWLCGGVSVNYHTLADFRVSQSVLLDALLIEHTASLAAAGVIDFDVLGQDGIRVRASAGAGSFRRRPTLVKAVEKARRLPTPATSGSRRRANGRRRSGWRGSRTRSPSTPSSRPNGRGARSATPNRPASRSRRAPRPPTPTRAS
jgi:transposase